MLRLSVQIKGLDKVIEQLDSTKEVLTNLEPEMQFMGAYLIDFFSNDVFETEGQIINENWSDLSPKYQLWKAKNYPGRGILERTGALRHGFEALPTATYCIIRNTVDYAKDMEFGTEYVPPRIFLKLDQERARVIREIIIDSLNTRVKEAIG